MIMYGTGEAAPSESVARHFGTFTLALSGPIAIAVLDAFTDRDHDFSQGSDGVILVDGMIHQVAAETWAARQIFTGGMAPLTTLHHARAVYEAHAIAHWMFQDFPGRWPRVLKEALRERQRFEDAARKSIGEVLSDVTGSGKELLDDVAVSFPPSLWDMLPGSAVLQYDHAILWKYASSFTHAGYTYAADAEPHSERVFMEQLVVGVVRHSAAFYRRIVDQFALDFGEADGALREAEEYTTYSFDVVKALGETFRS